MANVTLTDLIAKIRKLTARPSTNQITDDTITDYVNLFYEYDFPQNLKIFDFKTTYSFFTQPNVGTYQLSQSDRNNYKSFEPPVYASGFSMTYYQNREQFYRLWPQLFTSMDFAVATAAIGAGPYANTLTSFPVMQNTVLLSVVGPAGTTLIAKDLPTPGLSTGTFTGDVLAGGTINYATGAISLTWNAIPPAGNIITAKWTPYQASRPLSILFYDDTFILRPIPDQAYEIELQAFLKPTAYDTANPNIRPFLDDYFQVLAYGASCKIFADSLEMENYQMIRPLYEEQLHMCERKSMMQIKTQRTQTIYSENLYWSNNRLPTQ